MHLHFSRKEGKCQMEFKLYQLVDGEWYHYGTWDCDTIVGLTAAANSLGLNGIQTKVEVVG
jgi:hypothetical protein